MLQINRRPIALDDVLGGKMWNSAQLGAEDLLRITYDSRQEYLESRATSLSAVIAGGLAAAASGGLTFFPAPLVIPNDEYWYIHGYNIQITVAGASTVNWFRPVLFFNPQSTNFRLAGPDQHPTVQAATGDTGLIGWQPSLWLGPGGFFGCAFGPVATGGGNPSCTAHVRATIVRV